jgi:hypothetical protein
MGIEYPLTGSLREILLGIEVTIIFFCLQFALLFSIKLYYRSSKNKELKAIFKYHRKDFGAQFEQYLSLLKIREFAWGFLFLQMALTYFMFVLSDFFAGDELTRLFFLYSGYLFFLVGLTSLTFSFEKSELKSVNYFYTKTFFSILILEMLSMVFFRSMVVIIGMIIWPIIVIMLIKLTRSMIERSKGLRTIAFPTYGLFLGLLLLLIGFIFTTDILMNLFGIYMRLIGDLIGVAGIIMCGLSFFFLPSFAEYDWLEKIRYIYIIHPSGISLYSYNFRPKDHNIESDLTTGAIIAIKSIIEEMSEKGKQLESIKKDNFTILLGQGTYCIAALIADEDSLSLREKIKSFIRIFENKYQKYLVHWFGNTDIFKDTDKIVKEIFPIN